MTPVNASRRNVILMRWFGALGSFRISGPTHILFLTSLGLNLTQIGQLVIVRLVAELGASVTAGWLSDLYGDRYGYRIALRMGVFVQTSGYAVLAVSQQFQHLAVSSVLLGLGSALISGADSAFTYQNTGDLYLQNARWLGLISALAMISAGILSTAIMGLWPTHGFRIALVAQTAVQFLMFGWSCLLGEPARQDRPTRRPRFSQEAPSKWLIAYAAFILSGDFVGFLLLQPYYGSLGVAVTWYGGLSAGVYLLMAVSAPGVGKYVDRLGPYRSLVGLLALLGGFLAAPLCLPGLWGLLGLVPLGIQYALTKPVIEAALMSRTRSYRATVVSIAYTGGSIGGCFGNLGLGWIADHTSLMMAFGASLAVYGVIGALLLSRLKGVNLNLKPTASFAAPGR